MFKHGKKKGGYTLVEVLVVVAIISILASMAVAGVAGLRAGAKQEIQRTTRHLHSLLSAARVYADTFRVRTAVVYTLDNYDPPLGPGEVDPQDNIMFRPITDLVTGQHVRVISAAAVLYELPRSSGHFAGKFVPVPDDAGAFNVFEGEQILMLNDPRDPTLPYFYSSPLARFDPQAPINRIMDLGMTSVETFVDTTSGPSGPFAPQGDFLWKNPVTARFPAHVFTPGGRLETIGSLERFTLFVAPPPDGNADQLIANPSDPTSDRIFRPLYLYRSTGRVKIAT